MLDHKSYWLSVPGWFPVLVCTVNVNSVYPKPVFKPYRIFEAGLGLLLVSVLDKQFFFFFALGFLAVNHTSFLNANHRSCFEKCGRKHASTLYFEDDLEPVAQAGILAPVLMAFTWSAVFNALNSVSTIEQSATQVNSGGFNVLQVPSLAILIGWGIVR